MNAAARAEPFDFDTAFHTHFRRVARVIVRVIQDPARAEELAVDVFCRLWRHPSAHGPHCAAWLHRAAVRAAIDELRKRSRGEKYERWLGLSASSGDPERARETNEERTRIRTVLARLRRQDAQLVALRAEGLSYEELAAALSVKPTSIGTMLRRAQVLRCPDEARNVRVTASEISSLRSGLTMSPARRGSARRKRRLRSLPCRQRGCQGDPCIAGWRRVATRSFDP